jgi:Zn-dependent peptidase ImmA (M78 family)
LAEFIALKYDSKITPLDEIIEEEELSVYYDDYGNGYFDGMTMFENNQFFIHLNTGKGNKKDSARGRFTLAHELGHYFIDTHRIGLKKGALRPHPSITNQKQHHIIEREADYFAACLLMPESRFKGDILRKKFSPELLDSLKNLYNVSRTACVLRYADIGNHPLLIIYAIDGVIRWTHSSEDFPFKTLLYDGKVPENMVIGEYFQNKKDVDVYRTEQVWAIDCFRYVRDEDVGRKFYEYCISHKNMAMSIVWED